jgi:hypothetical protein
LLWLFIAILSAKRCPRVKLIMLEQKDVGLIWTPYGSFGVS